VGRSLASVVGSILELSELQMQLVIADVKAAARRAILPIALLALLVCFTAGVTSVLLIGLAEALVVWTDLTRSTAYLAISGAAACVAVLMALMGVLGLRKSVAELRHSYRELTENVACIRSTFSTRESQN
jgi:hypothetical protein